MRARHKISRELITPRLRSHEDVKADLEGVRDTWNTSKACERLKTLLDSTKIPPCNKVVAFALGEFSRLIEEEWQHRSASQYALLLTLCDVLRIQTPERTEIACYVQDPAYSDVDHAVLSSYGVNVVDDPEGFLQVDDSTAVISCGPNAPVREIVTELAQPPLMIWDTVVDAPQELRWVDE